jgi:peptidase A4-like protein
MRIMRGARRWPALAVFLTSLSAGAAPALADSTTSSNWAGYAVHRSGVKFKRVIGAWRVQSADCTGDPTYSATWIGIGGYSLTSAALEQIGTEVDCTKAGAESISAWYELVPSLAKTIKVTAHAGDVVAASVQVVGHTVTLGFVDETTHKTFERKLHPSQVDVTSAEWIVEAPSDCTTSTDCTALPLADLSTTSFALARAQTTAGHVGTISNRKWTATEIRLTTSARHLAQYATDGIEVAAATPSALTDGGSAFSITLTADTATTPTAGSGGTTTTTGGGTFPGGGSGPGDGPGSGSGGGGPGGGPGGVSPQRREATVRSV